MCVYVLKIAKLHRFLLVQSISVAVVVVIMAPQLDLNDLERKSSGLVDKLTQLKLWKHKT